VHVSINGRDPDSIGLKMVTIRVDCFRCQTSEDRRNEGETDGEGDVGPARQSHTNAPCPEGPKRSSQGNRTLSRVERGNLPDLATLGKLCRWLEIDPAEVLGVKPVAEVKVAGQRSPVVAAAHLRTGRTSSPKLANALAELVFAAERMMGEERRQRPDDRGTWTRFQDEV